MVVCNMAPIVVRGLYEPSGVYILFESPPPRRVGIFLRQWGWFSNFCGFSIFQGAFFVFLSKSGEFFQEGGELFQDSERIYTPEILENRGKCIDIYASATIHVFIIIILLGN